MITECPRCGGQMLKNYGEPDCVNCGYVPRPDPSILKELMEWRNQKLWSFSHPRIKGRRR